MKRIISALLSATLLAGVAAMPAAAAETYSLGDVTMDGVVDLADAMDVMRYYTNVTLLELDSNLTEDQIALADVNYYLGNVGDGVIDTADGSTVLDYYVYTLLVENPIAPETFFEDRTYWNSLDDDDIDGIADFIVEESQQYKANTPIVQ